MEEKINQPIYKIKDSVDIYEIPVDSQSIQIQFYKINTRDKLTIKVTPQVSSVLAKLDGKTPLPTIFKNLGLQYKASEAKILFQYLIDEGIAVIVSEDKIPPKNIETERYSRQINFFDDLFPSQSGITTQKQLEKQEIVVFGVGATGSTIAIHLVRAGIKKITLIDYKKVDKGSLLRHLYTTQKSIGSLKTQTLKNYLQKINPNCQITTINKKLIPSSELSEFISDSTSLVINSADEPYIGHTTLKLGRYLWRKNIALYVAGGFDAHLMSTGELIMSGLTPCADCCANTFKKALKTWTPTYPDLLPVAVLEKENNEKTSTVNIGGAGGISAQSLFSASYASINIINYLIGNYQSQDKFSKRGEYIINTGAMTWVDLQIQEGCEICGY